jgi:cytochrome oxidase Cu insertion factor (SCO1/SenC/PrrC family)
MLLLSCLLIAGRAAAHGDHVEPSGPADDYVYPLAAPGSYELPVIKKAGDGVLLDETGRERRLGALLEGRITILAFIYTNCAEVCPLASQRLADLQDLAAATGKSRHFQLISVSFDPANDTPDVMARYAETWRSDEADAPDWFFLTAADEPALTPLLKAYDQPVAEKPEGDTAGGNLSHLLRVFLIDPEKRLRNIYSADFLDPRLVLNDVLTLAGE